MNKNQPSDTFANNILLVMLEYVLEVGVDGALDHVAAYIPKEDYEVFPRIREALRKRQR